MIDAEVRQALNQKQDVIPMGMPVPQEGMLGDLRTNVPHGGKFYQMMKTGENAWSYSAPFTKVPSIHTLADYLLLTGGRMRTGAKIENLRTLDLTHTAEETDDHALEIAVDAAGFGDVKALEINYTTGAIVLGDDEGVILINIDESLATGGDVFAFEVLATEGSANIVGLKVGVLVAPVHHDSGTFEDMDSALVNATDRLAEFIASDPGGANNVEIFSADNDTVTIGDAAKFEELEFLLETGASGGGVKPTFEFSTGANPTTWSSFTPVDGTDGMKHTGIVAWEDADIPTWAVDGNAEYLIRITRTRNSLSTVPVEDKVQIAAVTEYTWDKNGDLAVRDISGRAGTFTSTLTTNSNYALEGYSTGRNVIRASELIIQPGTTPGTHINITDNAGSGVDFNNPTINDATDLTDGGAASGSFTLADAGRRITMNLTEGVISVLIVSIMRVDINSSST
ncbi:MAG TPA: hypothetical protein ENI27_04650, partial [bacterium]|nr:hypothetical protein [bacterium]